MSLTIGDPRIARRRPDPRPTSRSSSGRVDGKPLVYLDSAATSPEAAPVIDALSEFYERHNANIHRGVYTLAEEATAMYEGARAKLARFIGAPEPATIVFTRGTTESTNLVAYAWARRVPARGRRDPAHRDGAPLEHRALAARRRGDRARPSAHPARPTTGRSTSPSSAR